MSDQVPEVFPAEAREVDAGRPAEAMRRYERFVGLDVHKRTVVACVLDAGGRVVHRQEFACCGEELRRFAAERCGPAAAVALEATSNTWAVCGVLTPLCGVVKVSNPLKTKAIAQANVKTDRVDATVLAQLLRCDYLPGVWAPDEATRRLRQLTGRRAALVADRTAIKNRIHSVLAGELIAVPMARLYEKNGLAWLREVAMDAQARAAVDSDLRLLEAVEREVALVDAELAKAAHGRAQAKLLMTLPGVDYVVAMTLLAALGGDASRFADGDHAASYLGLTPSTKQSAEHCYHGPITKAGNGQARWMLVEAAQHLDKHPGPLGVFFRRLAKRKNRNVAVVATARKLVTIGWMMLTRGEAYRYAQPQTLKAKLARLRLKAGGKRRVGGIGKGGGRHPNYGSGRGRRVIDSLQKVCADEGLPAPVPLGELAAGERRMLEQTGTLAEVEPFREQRSRLRGGRSPACDEGHGATEDTGAGHQAPSPAPEPPPLPHRSPGARIPCP